MYVLPALPPAEEKDKSRWVANINEIILDASNLNFFSNFYQICPYIFVSYSSEEEEEEAEGETSGNYHTYQVFRYSGFFLVFQFVLCLRSLLLHIGNLHCFS